MNKRVLFSDNGTLIDLSSNLNRYDTTDSQFAYTAGEDYLYIGGRLPFNSFYVHFKNANALSSVMSIDVYDGDKWTPVSEVIDETNGFKASGHVTFFPDKESGWMCKHTNSNGTTIEGLTSIKIYDKYWIRISFNQTLTSSTSIIWIGSLFCDDTDIGSEYPDLTKNSVLSAFSAGKQSWEEQRIRASEIIIQDLMINRVIVDSGQMLEREDYRMACVQKTAEIIFNAFGDDFVDQKRKAREEYQRRLSNPVKKIDINLNGIEDKIEAINPQGWLSR